jgi:hypothetical protein
MHQNEVTAEIRCSQLVRRPPKAAPENQQRLRGYFDFRAAARRLPAGFVSGCACAAGGLSPSTPLSGQILKAGHLLQPATTAIGQIVMGIPSRGSRPRSMRA